MTARERAVKFTLSWEGGYANDSGDAGGETFRGISRVFHPDNPIWPLIDAMKSSPLFPQVVNLDLSLQKMAEDFYISEFWDRIHGDELPEKTAMVIFDMAINSGCGMAARLLQSVLGILADGNIGPVTIKAAHEKEPEIIHWLFFAREDFYLDLMRRKPEQRKWAVNWFTRLSLLRGDVLGYCGQTPRAS